jgi:hypothetical protein
MSRGMRFLFLGKEGFEMRRRMVFPVVVLSVLSFCLIAFAESSDKGAAVKGKEITVTGQLTCTFCKLANPEKKCPPGCCENCVKAGDPPLLTADDGNQYILLTGEHEVPLMTPERYKMLGGRVRVKGIMVKGKGVQVIYVDTMEQAPHS